MKQYRLGYDYVLLCAAPFEDNNQTVISLTFDVLFKILDAKQNEVLFQADEPNEQKVDFGNGHCFFLNELIHYGFDAEKGVVASVNQRIATTPFSIQYEIRNYYKDIQGEFYGLPMAEPEKISAEAFMEILHKQAHLFAIRDNVSLQSGAYFTEEVDSST